MSVSYDGNGRVSSVTNHGVTYTYAYDDTTTPGTRITTVTDPSTPDPNPHTRIYRSDTTTFTLTSVTDELSRTTSYQYDGSGRVTRVTFPLGNYVSYAYDARGNVTETRRVAVSGSGLPDIVTTASYDGSCSNQLICNQPISTTDALGHTTHYTYDSTHGGVLTVTAPDPSSGAACPASGAVCPQTRITYAGRQAYFLVGASSWAYSLQTAYLPAEVSACASGTADGSPSCVGTTAETRTTVSYGPTGMTANNLLPVSVTTADGSGALSATTAAAYDRFSNLATVDGPLSGADDTTTFRYDVMRRRTGVISPVPDGAANTMLRRAQRTTYGGPTDLTAGMIVQVDQGTVTGTDDSAWAAFAMLQRVAFGYDDNRRPERQVLRNASGGTEAVRDLSYDALARPLCAAIRMNSSTWSASTAACTQQSAGTDRIIHNSYNAASQPTQSEEGYGTSLATAVATRTYTSDGIVKTLTDGENNRTTYVYDGHRRLTRTRMPSTTQGSGTSSTTDYEELTYETHASGTRTSGQIASHRLRDNTSIAFGYDALGRLTLKNLPGSELDVAYGYNLLGRMTSAVTSAQTVSFTFDGLGRNIDQTGPQGTATSQYDLAGRRTRLIYPGSGLYVDYDYLLTGETTRIRQNGDTSGIGVLATYAYNDLGQRTSLTMGNGTSTTTSYDAAYRLQQLVQELDGTTYDLTLGFSYNRASQITGLSRSNLQFEFASRTNGNVTDAINGLNQVTSTNSSATTISYGDSRGNITGVGSASYGYSSENLLTSAPNSTTLGYDPLTRLYQIADGSSTTRFAYDAANMIAEYDGSNTLTRRYVFGPGGTPIVWFQIGDSTPRRWLHADQQGSIIAVTNDSGTMIGGGNYDEYGNPQSGAIAGRFGYTGQAWLSELGMWYYRARIYNPALGRFMQTDPIGYAGGMNLYVYVGDDPVNLADPLGLCNAVDVAHMDKSDECPQPEDDIVVKARCRGASCDALPGFELLDFLDRLTQSFYNLLEEPFFNPAADLRDTVEDALRRAQEAARRLACSLPSVGVAAGAEGFSGPGGGVSGGLSFNPQNGQFSVFGSPYVGAGIGGGPFVTAIVGAPTGLSANLTGNVSASAFGVGASGSQSMVGSSTGSYSAAGFRAGQPLAVSATVGAEVSLPVTPQLWRCS